MTPERSSSPELLMGKTILEVVSLLPTFPWYYEVQGGAKIPIHCVELRILDYDTNQPAEQVSVFGRIPMTPGVAVPTEEVVLVLASKPGRTVGLTSMVFLTKKIIDVGCIRA